VKVTKLEKQLQLWSPRRGKIKVEVTLHLCHISTPQVKQACLTVAQVKFHLCLRLPAYLNLNLLVERLLTHLNLSLLERRLLAAL
jgi:hypothetical protein